MQRRIDNAAYTFSQQPFLLEAIDDSYALFLSTGVLPVDKRMAWPVLKRALCARKVGGGVSHQEPGAPLAGPPREQVFREAVHQLRQVRQAARGVIRALVSAGLDPTDPDFIPREYPKAR